MVGIGAHGAILIKDDFLTIDEVVPAFAGPEGISLLVGQDDRVVDTERSDLHQRIAFVGAKFIEGGTCTKRKRLAELFGQKINLWSMVIP